MKFTIMGFVFPLYHRMLAYKSHAKAECQMQVCEIGDYFNLTSSSSCNHVEKQNFNFEGARAGGAA